MSDTDTASSASFDGAGSTPYVGKRKALCIGLQYDFAAELSKGDKPPLLEKTHRDPLVMRKLLIDFFGYKESDITVLRDKKKGPRLPTRDYILLAIKDLVKDAQPGDHFVFHFSGHGSQVPNTGKDDPEEDGQDEVLWPADVKYDETKGNGEEVTNYILDDDLNTYLVEALPDGAHLTAILDCCHSGTGMDLPYTQADDTGDPAWSPVSPAKNAGYSFANFSIVDSETKTPDAEFKPVSKMKMPFSSHAKVSMTAGGNNMEANVAETVVSSKQDIGQSKHVTSWSACVDSEIGIEGPKGGLLTRALDSILRQKRDLTYRELVHAISIDMVTNTRPAKPIFKANEWELHCPRPVIGCNKHLDEIYDLPFTF